MGRLALLAAAATCVLLLVGLVIAPAAVLVLVLSVAVALPVVYRISVDRERRLTLQSAHLASVDSLEAARSRREERERASA